MRTACLWIFILTGAIAILPERAFGEPFKVYRGWKDITYEDCFYGFRITLDKADPQLIIDHPEYVDRYKTFGGDPLDYNVTLAGRPPVYYIRTFQAPGSQIGAQMESLLAQNRAEWQEHLARAWNQIDAPNQQGAWEDPRTCTATSTIYDETGIPRTILNRPRCVQVVNLVNDTPDGWEWYCSGEPIERWPPAIKDAVSLLLSEGADLVMTRGVLTGEMGTRGGNPLEDLRADLEWRYRELEYCSKRYPELTRLVNEEKDPARRMELEVERTGLKEFCPTLKPSIELYEKTLIPLAEQRFNRIGWFTEEERARYRGWLMWRETRCARMVLEGRTEEAKKDFECRSIQIRDYLQFGPKGATEEVLKERAARELAPAPPKLPWETAAQPQETSGNSQGAGGAADGAGGPVSDGSRIHPSAVPGTGSRLTPHGSPLTNPRAQAAGVAGLIALLGALVLRRSRP
jgi:hypothetical protein